MAGFKAFMKRHTLWMGFLAVLAPLVLLLGLQFEWLARLKTVSASAHKSDLHNYLEVVGKEVQYNYRSKAERSLNLPSSLFTDGVVRKAASHWKKHPFEGARRFFLVDYTHSPTGNYWVYDEKRKKLVVTPAADESLAIIVACQQMMLNSFLKVSVDSPNLSVDERNPEYRIILNPITNDHSNIVGVAGMILDESFFTEKLLPRIINVTLPHFFPERAVEELVVTVRDDHGKLAFATGESTHDDEVVTTPIPYVFQDWSLWLHSPPSMAEQLANENFATNVSLLAFLAIALMCGIGLVFHAANRAMKLSQMKSDFVSNVSHELRTPLASIRVFAELLRLGRISSPDKAQEYGEYIEAESRRLSGLINNILDFSRIESGQKTYRFVHADISEVVGTTLKTFEIRLKPSGFRIRYEGPHVPLPSINLDPDAIAQAIHNLLDNAVKYSGESRDIDVRLSLDPQAIVIAVQDHGIGIARGEQPRIFDRFHRVSTGLVHNVKGSGLGLSIVRHIVQAHNGSITVASEPGHGTTLSIRLPLDGKAIGIEPVHDKKAPEEAADLGIEPGA